MIHGYHVEQGNGYRSEHAVLSDGRRCERITYAMGGTSYLVQVNSRGSGRDMRRVPINQPVLRERIRVVMDEGAEAAKPKPPAPAR